MRASRSRRRSRTRASRSSTTCRRGRRPRERVGGALDELAKRHALLEVERVSEPGDADLIWLNTPSKAAKAACRDCAHYNHVAGARSALEDKCRMGELQRRMGERTLRSETFADRGALRAWVAKHGPALDGGWVVKDATANSGVGLWFAASPVCAAPYAAPVPGEALAGTAHVTNVSVNKDADEAAGGAFVPERPILDLAAAHPAQFAAMKRVLRSLSARRPASRRPRGRNRFELVGVDFLCDDDAADPHAWLVECNCPPNSAGSAAEGPIEAFHHALMVDVLDRFVVGGSARGRWVAVDAGAPDVPAAVAGAGRWQRALARRARRREGARGPSRRPSRRLGPFFAANASTALDTVARAGGPWLDGRAIAVCDASHEANVVPWLRLAAGRELRTWRVDGAAGAPDLAALDGLLDDAVRVVAVPPRRTLRRRHDAATVVAKVRASCPGALVIVDGVAYAPHRRADAAGLEADCYVCASTRPSARISRPRR
ncbi:hypothetical protein JL721_2305 [Aureococcus anophagefferens]|nr:hypothetical protein JL721_2305 [Aureococcus anophagefferens]